MSIIGNRIADYQANISQKSPLVTSPLGLHQLPIRRCEYFMNIVDNSRDEVPIIDDVRRMSIKYLHDGLMEHWRDKSDSQGRFAHVGTIELGRVILRFGSTSSSLQS